MAELHEKHAISLKSDSEKLDLTLAEYANAETAEDKALRLALQAIADGKEVLDLTAVVVDSRTEFATTREVAMPGAAFAPASEKTLRMNVHYRRAGSGGFASTFRSAGRKVTFSAGNWSQDMPFDVINWAPITSKNQREVTSRDMVFEVPVPHVPLRIREKFDITDPGRVVFFETGKWSLVKDDAKTLTPPKPTITDRRDPVLAKHLVGRLYIIEAAWDLTDLEAKLLAGIKGHVK